MADDLPSSPNSFPDKVSSAAMRRSARLAIKRRAVTDAIGFESYADVATLVTLFRQSISKSSAAEQRAAFRAWLAIGDKKGWLHENKVVDPLDKCVD